MYSIGITLWEIFKRCIDGKYSKPWYSEYDFPPNMDFMILMEAQKGKRPTLNSSSFDDPQRNTVPECLSQIYKDTVHMNPDTRPTTSKLLKWYFLSLDLL